MDIRSLSLVLAVVVIFGLALFWIIRTDKQGRRDRGRIAATLGFEPIDDLDEKTAARLISLHRHTQSQELRVVNAAEKMDSEARFLIFDLIDYGGDSVSTLVNAGLAVFSPDLCLPRFSLIPRVVENGRLADISNRLLEMLIEKRSNRIQLNQNKYFEERYFLLGNDQLAIGGLLDEYRQSRLGQFAYRHLEADADCFTYSRFVFATRGKRNPHTDLKRDISEAQALLALFSG